MDRVHLITDMGVVKMLIEVFDQTHQINKISFIKNTKIFSSNGPWYRNDRPIDYTPSILIETEKFGELTHFVIYYQNDTIFDYEWYNKTIQIIEDKIEISIEEFTDGIFHYITEEYNRPVDIPELKIKIIGIET